MKRIALDAMGGDHGLRVVVPAAINVLKTHPDVSFLLVGDQKAIFEQLKKSGGELSARLQVVHASEVVAMDEKPSNALRYKKDSSMRVAINQVKLGLADACVSAGNTGALMATARFVLKTLPGIERPAILGRMPTRRGETVRMVDLGANVDSTSEQLFQFAVMGSIISQFVDGVENPKIALLNIGEEEIKGNEQVKQTAKLLAESDCLNYVGYLEGNDINTGGIVDVIVCDGFIGNVAIKASEGVAKLIGHYIRRHFMRTWYTRLVGLLAKPILTALKAEIDPANYNGATLVGLQGIVVKSHGGTNIKGFMTAIREAISEIDHQVPEKISGRLSQLFDTDKMKTIA